MKFESLAFWLNKHVILKEKYRSYVPGLFVLNTQCCVFPFIISVYSWFLTNSNELIFEQTKLS